MPQRHLDIRLFDKLLRGDVRSITPDEARDLAWHLMESCDDCAEAAGVDWVLEHADEVADDSLPLAAFPGSRQTEVEPASEDHDFEEVFDRVVCRVRTTVSKMNASFERAPALVQDLLRQSSSRQRLLVVNDRRFHNLPVAELLLEEAWQAGPERPVEAESLAELALEIVDRIDMEDVSARLLEDIKGRAWGLRGNFRRIAADFRGANDAFQKAWEHAGHGSGDLLERARLLTLESTLCRYQKRHERASEMLEETVQIYRALDEVHLLGRTMLNQALMYHELGNAAKAIDVLQEAQGLIDPAREPHLLVIAQQNRLVYLSELGRYEEAMALVPSLRHKLVTEGTRVELLRLRWLEGTIHVGLGNDARAEAALLEVRRGMVELELPKDAAVVSLELAALYTRQRRTGEIRELAAQMFPIFQSRDLHQEAIAALLLFQRAVEMDTLTLRMVEEVADVVRRSQERPRPQSPEPS